MGVTIPGEETTARENNWPVRDDELLGSKWRHLTVLIMLLAFVFVFV
jgi:hypothetical protein